ncbi:MAG: protein kinase, partial [Gemmatimonadetes bacterium]|nr:protein kinase [Gemmatimonadota bacterium]
MSDDERSSAADEMLPRDWPELAPLVDLLLDTRPSERAPLLMQLSAGNSERERTLERLLAECERDLPLLNRPAAELFDQLVGEDEPPALPELVAGRYRTGHEVGRGGMARVYLAHDIKHDREVAIKVIRAEISASLGRDRFLREIGIAARLRHPNILPLYDSGEANGSVYFVMPFEGGPSLSVRLVRDGPLPISEALSVLRDVARALQYAHAQGVVHRDIKPDNILLSGGAAVVMDFGIAKALSASIPQASGGPASGTLSQLGTSLGTPAYMAPEQAAGDPATDHRADLYAWGVVAYELLAGRHPFAGHTSPHALMAAHFSETPAPLPETIPRALAALVMRCLAKAPAQRPASTNELLAALEAAPLTSGEEAVPPTVPARGRGPRAAPIALAVIGLAVLVGGAWAWRAHVGAPAAPPLVAVLPFETVADAGGIVPDSTFADALGDAITGKLARLKGLHVMDRASVRSVPQAAAHPQAAGRTLHADYVLRATLRWARGADGAPRVQVSPVLVRVADGTTKWAGEPRVVTPGDPFAAQGTLATEVAEALDV